MPKSTERQKGAYYGGVDVVRLIAAMMVMVYHLGFDLWRPGISGQRIILTGMLYPSPAPVPSFSFGWVGVQIFFVISGLVIANSSNGVSASEFLKHRIYRLYPTAWICASVEAIILLCFGLTSHLAIDYLRSVALWIHGPWITPVYWSLAVEISFYAIVFLWLLFLARVQISYLAGGLFLVGAIGAAMHMFSLVRSLESFLPVILYGVYFSLGIYIWIASVRRLAVIEWLFSIGALTLGALYILRRPSGGPLPVAIWIVAVLCIAASSRMPGGFLRSRSIRTLGLMTYPVYLFHPTIGEATMRALMTRSVPAITAVAVAAVIVLCAAFIVVWFMEPPLRKLLQGQVAHWRNIAAMASPIT